MEVAVSARRRQKGVVGRIRPGRLLEDGDSFGRLAVLLQQRCKVHGHQAVFDAGRQQAAQRRLGLGHLAGTSLQYRRFSLLRNRLGPHVRQPTGKRQHGQAQEPSPSQGVLHRSRP
jgi:hypothetical protein